MIEVSHLVKQYGKYTAVNDLSFTVHKGEILGFLGPNGAGKSTTMNMLTGYLSSSSGTIKINDIDILEDPLEAKKNIGYLPEIPPLYTDMTVKEYLQFVASLKKVPRAEQANHINEILAQVSLEPVATRLIKNLSKGYKQRVGLAQALIGTPELLILDEPTVGLDPKQIIEMRSLIKSLSKNHTIILSSHILSEISAICDRIMIINKGELVAIDTPDNLSTLFNSSAHVTIRVPSCTDLFTKSLRCLPGVYKVSIKEPVEKEAFDIEIEISKDVDARVDIFNLCSKMNNPLLMMQLAHTSLEDIFLQVTSITSPVDSKPTRQSFLELKAKRIKEVSSDTISEIATTETINKEDSVSHENHIN